MPFDITDLQLVVRIAALNSVTKGAKALSMSPSGASMRIKRLEESTGIQLMERANRRVTLTPSGQVFVHHARILLNQIEQLQTDLQENAKGTKQLRVWANVSAFGFLPRNLIEYVRAHPHVALDVRERMSHDIVRAVSEGHADVGIVAGSVRTENLQTFPYHRERLAFVVPRSHPLAKASGVNFIDTIQFHHIAPNDAGATQIFLREIVAQSRRTFKARIQVDNHETACRMIELNLGVGVMPESVARRCAKAMAIRVVPLHDEWALRSMRICVRSLEALPGFRRDLVNLMIADARKALRDKR